MTIEELELGDTVICTTLKEYYSRPRPKITYKDSWNEAEDRINYRSVGHIAQVLEIFPIYDFISVFHEEARADGRVYSFVTSYFLDEVEKFDQPQIEERPQNPLKSSINSLHDWLSTDTQTPSALVQITRNKS